MQCRELLRSHENMKVNGLYALPHVYLYAPKSLHNIDQYETLTFCIAGPHKQSELFTYNLQVCQVSPY